MLGNRHGARLLEVGDDIAFDWCLIGDGCPRLVAVGLRDDDAEAVHRPTGDLEIRDVRVLERCENDATVCGGDLGSTRPGLDSAGEPSARIEDQREIGTIAHPSSVPGGHLCACATLPTVTQASRETTSNASGERQQPERVQRLPDRRFELAAHSPPLGTRVFRFPPPRLQPNLADEPVRPCHLDPGARDLVLVDLPDVVVVTDLSVIEAIGSEDRKPAAMGGREKRPILADVARFEADIRE